MWFRRKAEEKLTKFHNRDNSRRVAGRGTSIIPSTMVLALEDHGRIAGMASSLGGTLQMVIGGIMIVIVSLFFDGTALPMVTTIALCAMGALILSFRTLIRAPSVKPAE